MFSQEVLIRRYTPPTCTLELSGNRSRLYLWTGQNRVKDIGFILRFDDPRNPTEDQIIVKGDRTQLQIFSDVVNHYIQNFLKTSSSHLPLTASSTATLLQPTITLPSIPSLHPLGLLRHELSFGSLIVEPPQSSVSLTASQLYDLANALEEYKTDISILPAIAKPKLQQVATTWLGTAVAAFLIALGVGTASLKIRENLQQTASLPEANSKPAESIVKDVLPPVPTPPTGTPVPSPSIPPTLAQRQPLPTPSTVVALPPPPRNPSIPVVIPPRAVLPPPPVVPSANNPAIIITPQTSNPSTVQPSRTLPTLPPPVAPRSTQNLSPQTFNPNPPAPNLPELPPLASSQETETAKTISTQSDKSQATLLDTIPQVGEARQYFKERWKPPESLQQTLEYRLVLSQDGSISRITPLGQASKIYLDRTGMPLIGETFVSPLEVAGNPQIRLVLSPDGTVRTFMEQ
ncbi:hypothetical protein C7H19_03440 [Aphanothece hegewaldii CCALA 016]|uniref:DUF4335 domain-containing protein n=1 Tax=Aphanothece hegewaldii CCALA 016 TaxID=2107694 RepID=A0A2T1M1I0_9CHRO|nr:DUF4335 domain-containing protein [Aphanothece hegewaldii]PSF38576.1 hypothetical protein C7H19_03440 [Aphanothece hegewaldii CCALA 016]